MNYSREIIQILLEAGQRGLSAKKVAQHVYNTCNTLFCPVDFEVVHRQVYSFLRSNSSKPHSMIEHTGQWGTYRLNKQNNKSKQLMLDFAQHKQDIIDKEANINKDEEIKPNAEDTSLCLFDF